MMIDITERLRRPMSTYTTEQAKIDIPAAADCIDQLVKALEDIADDRGVCSTCGTPAIGSGAGYTACHCTCPNWREVDPRERARAALSKLTISR